MTAPRGILKPSTVFPLEHELRSYDKPRTRSRSRDRRHADEELQLVVSSTSALHREKSTSSHSTLSRRPVRSRRRSQSRSRRHVRWSDPIEFVVNDGQDMLSRELRHRRSSLPGILEDTRTLYRETLREQKKDEDTRASSSSSSRKRPQLKSAASSPDVGRSSQDSHPSKPLHAQVPVHAPTPISSEHRKRRTSLPNGLEAAVNSPSHALWLPHPTDQQESDHPAPNVNGHSPPHSNGFPSPHSTSSLSHPNGHSRQRSGDRTPHHSSSYVLPAPQTPHRHELAQLPPHLLREQPNLHGRGLAPPPPVTFMNKSSPLPRPISQLTTSTQRSTKSSRSSPPEERSSPLALPAPPIASPNPPAKPSPVPSTKQINEPITPRSTKSSLFTFPTIDDVFSKEDTSHSKLSIRRLFGLSPPKHEPRKLDDEDKPNKKSLFSKDRSKETRRQEPEPEVEPERRRTTSNSFFVHPPTREPLHRARHSFDLGTFSLLDDMHMRWTTATARHFLPVLTPAEIQASHLTLHLNPGLTTVHWDIRHPPTAVWSVVPGRKTRLWSGHDEPATVPLVPTLRIISSYFPWVITARNPNGVTCGDVLSAIHTSARQLVWRGEFEQLRTADKNRLAAGYHANRPVKGDLMTADAPFEAGSWLVRADWLGRYTVLRGMSANETRDKHGQPGEVMLNMYLVENKKEKPLVVRP